MAKTVVGLLSLPQPLLLYLSLEPAMLDNIGGVKELIGIAKQIEGQQFFFKQYLPG
jgi:hypothetical protein